MGEEEEAWGLSGHFWATKDPLEPASLGRPSALNTSWSILFIDGLVRVLLWLVLLQGKTNSRGWRGPTSGFHGRCWAASGVLVSPGLPLPPPGGPRVGGSRRRETYSHTAPPRSCPGDSSSGAFIELRLEADALAISNVTNVVPQANPCAVVAGGWWRGCVLNGEEKAG